MLQKYNKSVVWEKESHYILRCIDAVFGQSAAGNPMLTFDYEVVSPDTMKVAEDEFTIAGVKVRTWQVCKTLVDGTTDEEKSKKNKDDVIKLYEKFGLPTDTLNVENPDTTGFKGKLVYAHMINDQQDERKTPSAEQLAKGIKQGDVLINHVTKLPMKRNQPKIVEIHGLAPADASKPY